MEFVEYTAADDTATIKIKTADIIAIQRILDSVSREFRTCGPVLLVQDQAYIYELCTGFINITMGIGKTKRNSKG